jgi:hypothetical protein
VRLAVVGDRNFTDYSFVEKTLDRIIKEKKFSDITIVSGGARGVDTLAEMYASKHNLPIKVWEADWDKFGKSAGPIRNEQVVHDSDFMVAFKAEFSKGTLNAINQAKNYALECIVINI